MLARARIIQGLNPAMKVSKAVQTNRASKACPRHPGALAQQGGVSKRPRKASAKEGNPRRTKQRPEIQGTRACYRARVVDSMSN